MRAGSAFPGAPSWSRRPAPPRRSPPATAPMAMRAAARSRSTRRRRSTSSAPPRRSAATSSSSTSRPIASSRAGAGPQGADGQRWARALRQVFGQAREMLERQLRLLFGADPRPRGVPRQRHRRRGGLGALGPAQSDPGRLCQRGARDRRLDRRRGRPRADPWRRLPAGAGRDRGDGRDGRALPGRGLEALSAIWRERPRHLPRPQRRRQPLLRAGPGARREDRRGAQGRAAARARL